jgi:tripartite-type tricarboxylate transporter receptor subunit TctC
MNASKPLLLALMAFMMVGSSPSIAQESAPMPPIIKLVVGFPAGGAADTVARALANELQAELKTSVIVENKPGAGGRLSLSAYRNAPKDGSIIMVAPNALTVLQSIVYEGKLDYDVNRDYQIIARLTTFPFGLAVPGTEPISSSKDLVNYLKINKHRAVYGTAAVGGYPHLAGLLYGKATGIDWQLAPYKGGAPLITDLIGGQLIASVNTLSEQIPHHRSKRLKIVGIFSAARNPLAPEIPTMIEQGVRMPAIDGWYAAYVRAGTPASVANRISVALAASLAKPNVKAKFNELLFEPSYLEPRSAKRHSDAEFSLYRPIVKQADLKPE